MIFVDPQCVFWAPKLQRLLARQARRGPGDPMGRFFIHIYIYYIYDYICMYIYIYLWLVV